MLLSTRRNYNLKCRDTPGSVSDTQAKAVISRTTSPSTLISMRIALLRDNEAFELVVSCKDS